VKELIAPHGGRLIDRWVGGAERERFLERSKTPKTVKLSQREVSDLEMLAIGAFSPLEGFQGSADYKSILANKRLANGLPWTIPITLSVSKAQADNLPVDSHVSLLSPNGQVLANLELEEKYPRAKEEEAQRVYGTIDQDHPGVAALSQAGEIMLAGKVFVVNRPVHANFHRYR
jgi:sulfate adenylyltransferase